MSGRTLPGDGDLAAACEVACAEPSQLRSFLRVAGIWPEFGLRGVAAVWGAGLGGARALMPADGDGRTWASRGLSPRAGARCAYVPWGPEGRDEARTRRVYADSAVPGWVETDGDLPAPQMGGEEHALAEAAAQVAFASCSSDGMELTPDVACALRLRHGLDVRDGDLPPCGPTPADKAQSRLREAVLGVVAAAGPFDEALARAWKDVGARAKTAGPKLREEAARKRRLRREQMHQERSVVIDSIDMTDSRADVAAGPEGGPVAEGDGEQGEPRRQDVREWLDPARRPSPKELLELYRADAKADMERKDKEMMGGWPA